MKQKQLNKMRDEARLINGEMTTVRNILLAVVGIIPSFNITDPKILPYGLKAHTRSIKLDRGAGNNATDQI